MAKTKADTTESVADTEADLPQPDEVIEIPYSGVTFVVPKYRDDWPTEGLAYLAEGKYNLFVKYTLEIAKEGQWNTVCAMCPRRKDFAAFFTEFGKRLEDCVG